jgi:hypothetical protein
MQIILSPEDYLRAAEAKIVELTRPPAPDTEGGSL